MWPTNLCSVILFNQLAMLFIDQKKITPKTNKQTEKQKNTHRIFLNEATI